MAREIMGLDEILGDALVGDDDMGDALVGAPLARGHNQALQAKRLQAARLVHDAAPTKSRMYVLPLTSAVIATLVTANVQAQPQVLFRAERWIISDPTPNFVVNDLKIGKNSQFAAAGTVPTAVFAANAFGVRLKMDTAQVSQQIIANVTNTSAGNATFTSALIGPAIE